ncbi:MAG: hypothetical protein EZS28_016538 [Streblomastix strix]|uniref:Uncharacterized protein n=1 Tax=Streblomastix strix TaxID=222440 RepID=A0A5J4W092_9EUKA|nr:MAG: hypothetical protein EZS28_016538 [Streblomastix strix]
MNVLELIRTVEYVLCVYIAKSRAGNVICPGYKSSTAITRSINVGTQAAIANSICILSNMIISSSTTSTAKNIQYAIPVETVKKLTGNTSGKVSTNAQILLKLIQEQ